jgi:serine phosphatase RsbU (regulator of sigma subunit)
MEVWGGSEEVDTAVSTPGLDIWVISRPAGGEDTGGDVYYLSVCAHGKMTRIALADVSGHGASVTPVAGRLRELMHENGNVPDQAALMRELNRTFTAAQKEGRYATAFLTTFVEPVSQFLACNAGHPKPLWFRAGAGEWQVLDHRHPQALTEVMNLPLGIIGETEYTQFGMEVSSGDVLLFYTDWLLEAPVPGGGTLGMAGIMELVRDLDPTRPEELGPSLIAKVADLSGGRPPTDDLTLLVVRRI